MDEDGRGGMRERIPRRRRRRRGNLLDPIVVATWRLRQDHARLRDVVVHPRRRDPRSHRSFEPADSLSELACRLPKKARGFPGDGSRLVSTHYFLPRGLRGKMVLGNDEKIVRFSSNTYPYSIEGVRVRIFGARHGRERREVRAAALDLGGERHDRRRRCGEHKTKREMRRPQVVIGYPFESVKVRLQTGKTARCVGSHRWRQGCVAGCLGRCLPDSRRRW